MHQVPTAFAAFATSCGEQLFLFPHVGRDLMDDPEAVVRAQSERRFLNEAIVQAAQTRAGLPDTHALIRVWCECGRDDCADVIDIRLGEYEAARLNARRFVVAPGHGDDGVDEIFASTSQFHVVEVRPGLADRAESLTPKRLPARPA